MNFELLDDKNKSITKLVANNETEAWKKLKRAGFQFKSNIFNLVKT